MENRDNGCLVSAARDVVCTSTDIPASYTTPGKRNESPQPKLYRLVSSPFIGVPISSRWQLTSNDAHRELATSFVAAVFLMIVT